MKNSQIYISFFFLILLTLSTAFSEEGGDVGNGSGGETMTLPSYDNNKIDQAISLIRQRMIETNIPHDLMIKTLNELENLNIAGNLLEIPGIYYLGQNSGCNVQHAPVITGNQITSYEACTTLEPGSIVYISTAAGENTQKLAQTILHETFHHILDTPFNNDEDFIDDYVDQILIEGNTVQLSRGYELGIYIKEDHFKMKYLVNLYIKNNPKEFIGSSRDSHRCNRESVSIEEEECQNLIEFYKDYIHNNYNLEENIWNMSTQANFDKILFPSTGRRSYFYRWDMDDMRASDYLLRGRHWSVEFLMSLTGTQEAFNSIHCKTRRNFTLSGMRCSESNLLYFRNILSDNFDQNGYFILSENFNTYLTNE